MILEKNSIFSDLEENTNRFTRLRGNAPPKINVFLTARQIRL